jgi:hypothetical protein
MPQRPNPKHRKTYSELLASSDLGRNARIFEDADVIRLLRTAVEREGSNTAFAERHGLPRSNVSNILSGKRPITSVVKALGLRWWHKADMPAALVNVPLLGVKRTSRISLDVCF